MHWEADFHCKEGSLQWKSALRSIKGLIKLSPCFVQLPNTPRSGWRRLRSGSRQSNWRPGPAARSSRHRGPPAASLSSASSGTGVCRPPAPPTSNYRSVGSSKLKDKKNRPKRQMTHWLWLDSNMCLNKSLIGLPKSSNWEVIARKQNKKGKRWP